ncbi:hypothetical protein [Lysinibacillus telephonicus]|uniref:Uncharacterized protein n=1 Tax=Lysinibacillus telephonicus TaxID=1714840 RepID=A0A431UQ97_9BACI|nr:hypothetical protein [Lysinibacillus telephonicus]RTQ92257.1 hypothetical protein EKG35_12275 [Lysinibacillus telephonicus]
MRVFLIYPVDLGNEDWIQVHFAENANQAIKKACNYYVEHTYFENYEDSYRHNYPEKSSPYYYFHQDEKGYLYDDEWQIRRDLNEKYQDDETKLDQYINTHFRENVYKFFNEDISLADEYLEVQEYNASSNRSKYGFSNDLYAYILRKFEFEIQKGFVVKEIEQNQ